MFSCEIILKKMYERLFLSTMVYTFEQRESKRQLLFILLVTVIIYKLKGTVMQIV